MTVSERTRVRFPVPDGWTLLPKHPEDLTTQWIEESLPEGTDAADIERVRQRAAELLQATQREGHPHLNRFAFITLQEPAGVRAYLETDAVVARDGDFERSLDLARNAVTGATSFRREVLDTPIGTTPTVAIGELVVMGTEAEPTRMQELFTAELFPPESGVALHLTLMTPDLARFGDLVQYGYQLAATMEVAAEPDAPSGTHV
jgi:hypothetical protein